MPRKNKKGRRSYRKRSYLSRGLGEKAVGGFPTKKLVKIKYAQEITLAGTSAGIVQHQFRCNSVRDPDFTGTGHQPMNFDRWAQLYDHYTVMSSVCKVSPTSASSANANPGYMGVMISLDAGGTSALANVTSLFENKLVSHKYMQTGNNAGNSRKWLASGVKSSFNAKRIFGVVNPEDGAAYGALVTSDPNRDAYFNIYLASISGNTPANQTALVEIEYTVLFDELVTQTQN